MSLFTNFNPRVGPGLTPAGVRWSHVRPPSAIAMEKHSAPPTPTTTHQLRAKEDSLHLKETSVAISRRDIVGLAGLSLAMFSISSPKPAEARLSRAEMKNKIMEKFRLLREKFEVSKPKESKEQTSEPAKDSAPQSEYLGEQKRSASQEDERREAADKPEGEQGKNFVLQTENESRRESTPQDDKSPFLPSLNLTEVDHKPLA